MRTIETRPSKLILTDLDQVANSASLLQDRALNLQHKWQEPIEDADRWCQLMFETERVLKIYAARQQNNAGLITKLDAVEPKTWCDLPELPCDSRKQNNLAAQMIGALGLQTAKPGVMLRINSGMLSRRVTNAIVEHCDKHDIAFDLETIDAAFDTVLVNVLNPEELTSLIELRKERIAACNYNVRIASVTDAEISAMRDAEKFKRYDHESTDDFYKRLGKGELEWNLTYIPTSHEAKLDGFEHAAYLDFFFEACDQPWNAIKKAQNHLIKCFDRAKELRITNSDGTDVRMSLEGHTFANSVVGHNIPGSEIFSGPAKESVEGTIVAKGNFAIELLGKTYRMKDITLNFQHGRIMSGSAAVGNDDLQTVLSLEDGLDSKDPKFEGSRHIGEIGIGTNPHIRQHSVNGLLVEKIGGSFHLALGRCYGNEYLGKQVLMANGNKSDIHWDITTMLRGKEGCMYLDGHLIQQDGEWIDCPEVSLKEKDVDVLNRGWAAIPEHQRPKVWREKLATQIAR